MKKYVKPELFYESFELSEQIALGCSELMSSLATLRDATKDCVVDLGGTTLLVDNATCTANPDKLEGYCYFAGSGDNAVFAS